MEIDEIIKECLADCWDLIGEEILVRES